MNIKRALNLFSRLLGAASILFVANVQATPNVIAWSGTPYSSWITNIPPSATNVISVATGQGFVLALRADGTVVSWGGLSTWVPESATNVVAIAAGQNCLALRADGTMVAWSNSTPVSVPPATNVIAIASGLFNFLALKADGTVLSWGSHEDDVAKGLSNVIAIACNQASYAALCKDGTYATWNIFNTPPRIGTVPDAVAIAVGQSTASPDVLFLKGNGEVINTTRTLTVPTNNSIPQMIASGSPFGLALNSDGTLTPIGKISSYAASSFVRNIPPSATNVIAISTSENYAAAVLGDGTPRFTGPPAYRETALVGSPLPLSARAIGSKLSYQWLSNGVPIVGATNANPHLFATLGADNTAYQVVISNALGCLTSAVAKVSVKPFWGNDVWKQSQFPATATNPVALSARSYHTLALNADGTITGWGKNVSGQASVPSNAQKIVAVATGAEHSLALKDDGTVVAWGRNADGQTTVPSNATNVVAVAAGSLHSVALRADGTIVAWGDNSVGQCTVSPLATEIVRIACGYFHTLALRADGRVIGWGSDLVVPDNATNVTAIAAGFGHNLALKADGAVLAWGDNNFGQATVPPSATNVIAIAAGWFHSMALKADGSVVVWGKGSSNAPTTLSNIGCIAAGEDSCVVIPASGPPQFALPLKSVQANVGGPVVLTSGLADGFGGICQWYHSGVPLPGATNRVLFLRNAQSSNSGDYVVLASNAFGQSDSQAIQLTVQPTPVQITTVGAWGGNSIGQTDLPAGIVDPREISAAGFHGLVLQADGTAIGWGNNKRGERDIPAFATNGAPGLKIISVASGRDHNLALRNDGTVVAWGYNGDGQTNVPAAATNVVAIAAGAAHSLALRNDGTVLAWGSKGDTNMAASTDYGQTNVPPSLTNAIAIAAGYYHSLAIRSNHTVVTWGSEYTVPEAATNVIAVAGGFAHSLALRADGAVIAWGDNTFGQTTVPPAASNAVAIAAGWFHSMALRADGTVVVWGTNYFGLANVPTGLSNVSKIAAGDDFCVVLVESGAPRIESIAMTDQPHVGGQALLSAQLGGSTPLDCQWYHDGAPIADATNRCLLLTYLQLADQGSYTLVVTNAAGTVTSDPTSVTVLASPSFDVAVARKTVLPGASFNLTAPLTGTEPLYFQWQVNGKNIYKSERVSGSSTARLNIDSAAYADSGTYSLVITNNYGAYTGVVAQVVVTPVLAWGDNSSGQLNVPPEAANAVAVAGGADHSLALRADGTVVAWGDNTYGQLNVPESAVNVVAIAAGDTRSLALRADGTVVAWGNFNSPNTGSWSAEVPGTVTNVVAIAAGRGYNLALRADGNSVAWGPKYSVTNIPPVNGIVAISAGDDRYASLTSTNTVWDTYLVSLPTNSSPVVAIAKGGGHGTALRADGTLSAWGQNKYNQAVIPESATQVIAIANGGDHSLALRADKTVVAWGANYSGQSDVPPSATNICTIAGGDAHSLALFDTGLHIGLPSNRQSTAGQSFFLTAGTTPGAFSSYQWQLNGTDIPGATNSFLQMNSLRYTNSGRYSLVISNAFGRTVSDSTSLSVPRSQMQLSSWVNEDPANPSVSIQLRGGSGVSPITIFASTNLVNWEPVFTNAPTLSPITFPDTFSTNGPARFYRAEEEK